MSRLVGGDVIPQVSLSPAAAPIQTNILPAPGQQLPGNTLQQIAESLSVFNSGLVAFGQAAVTQDNRRAAQAGSSLDLRDVVARGEHLNKSFKKLIAERNLPDSANPYFIAAAERNFGSVVAMKVRSGVLARLPQLSDPNLDSASQAGLLRQVVAEETSRWGGDRLQGNFYAGSSFNEEMNQILPQVEQEIMGQYLRQKESLSLIEYENGLSEYLMVARTGGDVRGLAEGFAARLTELQRYTTDPEKIQGALYRTAVTAFQSASSTEQLDAIEDAVLSVPYGRGGTVATSMSLRASVASARERAERDVESRADDDERRFVRSVQASERLLGEGGITAALVQAATDGTDPLTVVREHVDRLPEGTAPAVKDEVMRRSLNLAAELAGNVNSVSRTGRIEDSNKLVGRIYSGEFGSVSEVVAAASALGLPAQEPVQLYEAWEQGTNKVVESINTEAEVAIKVLRDFRENAAQDAPFDDFRIYGEIVDETRRRMDMFVTGQDEFNGKTYEQYRRESRSALNAALAGRRSQVMSEIIAERKLQLQQAATVEQQRRTLAPTTSQSLRSVQATTPAAQQAHVKDTIREIRESFAPVYAPFGFEGEMEDPIRVSDVLSQMSSSTSRFDRTIRTGGTLALTNRPMVRHVEFDGSTYRVYEPFSFMQPDRRGREVGVFTREMLASYAINLRMQRLGGFSARQVIADETGIEGITIEAIKSRNGGTFDWVNVPVFGSPQEYEAFVRGDAFSDEEREALLRRVLGNRTSEKDVEAFKDAQLRLLNERELYRSSIR